jgi:histidine triad (HIT) family protein
VVTTDPECIFCRIVAGEIPASVVARTDTVLAFRDLNPQAETHILVVPREHHQNVVELAAAQPQVLADLVTLGSKIADDESGGSFRLFFNTGAAAGQTVFHVHGHVLAGRFWGWAGGSATH